LAWRVAYTSGLGSTVAGKFYYLSMDGSPNDHL
jgi:hypothetical protein